MGIVRYPVQCAGCSAGIVLRIGVGYEQRQPFFFVCQSCHAATKAALIWHGGAHTELELEDGDEIASEQGCTQTVHVYPEYPSVPDAPGMEAPGGSAFLYHSILLGIDRVRAYQERSLVSGAFARDGWPALRRLTEYYVARDWPHFDRGLESVFSDPVPVIHNNLTRHNLIHRLYDKVLLRLASRAVRYYPIMKCEWNMLWTIRSSQGALQSFAADESNTDEFKHRQRDLFTLAESLIHLRRTLLIGTLCSEYPEVNCAEQDGLRVFVDEFAALRDIYIQNFEQCHKSLRYAIGALNVVLRGNANAFPPWPSQPSRRANTPLSSLAQFDDLTAANKRIWVSGLPRWHAHWDDLFDRRLRNDIGHASIRHRLRDGMLVRDNGTTIRYLDFVLASSHMAHSILLMMNIIKILCIYGDSSPE